MVNKLAIRWHAEISNAHQWVLLTLVLFGVPGCATVELASLEEDQTAKEFVAPSGRAAVYLTRKSKFEGSAVLYPIIVDGEVKVLTGWSSHSMEINRLSEEDGRGAVAENKLAKAI